MSLRPLRLADVPALLTVQAQCYEPGFLEGAAAFEAKLCATEALRTSWMAWRGEEPLAYLVTLPACADSLPALDAPAWAPSAAPRFLYLHDLAVAPAGRALGLGRRLLDEVEARAAALGLRQLGLVAVQGARPYWERQGFALPHQAQLPAPIRRKLASFGAAACWMERGLATAT